MPNKLILKRDRKKGSKRVAKRSGKKGSKRVARKVSKRHSVSRKMRKSYFGMDYNNEDQIFDDRDRKYEMSDSDDYLYNAVVDFFISDDPEYFDDLDELVDYLNDLEKTCDVVKLFLQKKKTFETIKPYLEEKFYINLFKCQDIFKTEQEIEEEIIEREKILKSLRIPSDIIYHRIKPFLDIQHIKDSIIELTKNYVFIDFDKMTLRTVRTNQPVMSIYENRHKNAPLFWAPKNTDEGDEGRSMASQSKYLNGPPMWWKPK
jgi:hypothetical protein